MRALSLLSQKELDAELGRRCIHLPLVYLLGVIVSTLKAYGIHCEELQGAKQETHLGH